MFNFLGGYLDNPLRGAGLQPDQADPQTRNLMRMQALSALGRQIGGRGNFFDDLRSMRENADKDAAAAAQRAQAQAQMAQQQQLAALFGQDPAAANATQAALGAPVAQAGPVGPTAQRAQLQQQVLQQVNPNKAKADVYRKAAYMTAATNPEQAKKYADLADQLDPREEFYAPTEGQGGFFQASKSGQVRGVDGFQPKQPPAPAAVQEYQFAVSQGYKGGFDQWDQARRRAGATNVSVTNAEKPFINALAPAIAQQVAGSAESAASARSTLATVSQIKAALPKAITGPGADARIYLSRLQSTLGVGGANEAEKLANTQRVLQGLAQTQLNAAEQMAGQGAITDFERGLIAQTAGGNINMTPAEITAALDAVEKVSRLRVNTFERNVQSLQAIPGMAPLMPFFAGQGGAPAATQPAPAAPTNIQEAARQELLRRQGAR